jgi:hypothetical protein
MNHWLTLILAFPAENTTARMRAWRALKACGSAVIRDGVYILPSRPACHAALSEVACDVRENQGTAYLLELSGEETSDFPSLFDRSAEFNELLVEIKHQRTELTAAGATRALKQTRKLRKQYSALVAIDFFPGAAQHQTELALADLDKLIGQSLSPDEPHAVETELPLLDVRAFQGRQWATRQRPWVDRLASAWLIKRHIDPAAQFVWLAQPADCPTDALGFDFDNARFSHVGQRVTFEVLCASFGLDGVGLRRLAALVHFLDVGGAQPPEAAGVEQVLAGLRETISDDDALLLASFGVFDGLLAAFNKDPQ